MKNIIIFISVLGCQLKAADPNPINSERTLAIEWAKSLQLNKNEECKTPPGGAEMLINIVEKHIDVLEQLIKIHGENPLKVENLCHNSETCCKFIQDITLHKSVRVYARLNLARVQISRAVVARNDIIKQHLVRFVRQNIVTSLVLIKESGTWKEAQTNMVYCILNGLQRKFPQLYAPIAESDIDHCEKELKEDPLLQYLI